MSPDSPRWKIVLVDRMQFYRFPRTKRRRILRKWRERPENYRPLMVPVGCVFMLGQMAVTDTPQSGRTVSPYYNEANPSNPRILEMHTALWERVKAEEPKFAALCDVFRQVTVLNGGIEFIDDVPV